PELLARLRRALRRGVRLFRRPAARATGAGSPRVGGRPLPRPRDPPAIVQRDVRALRGGLSAAPSPPGRAAAERALACGDRRDGPRAGDRAGRPREPRHLRPVHALRARAALPAARTRPPAAPSLRRARRAVHVRARALARGAGSRGRGTAPGGALARVAVAR